MHDDCCVVAAQLEDSLTEASVDVSADVATNSCGASEGDQRNTWVLNHSVSDVGAISCDHSYHTVEAVLLQDVTDDSTESDSHKRHGLSALPNDLIAADEGESSVPSHDSAREVEGCDHTDVSDRIPDLHHEVSGPLRI